MKILVTGGAGYVGVGLVASLSNRGHDVTVIDNFRQGSEAVPFLVCQCRAEVIARDLRDIDESFLSGFDVVYHLAGISSYPACEANPTAAFSINEEGTRRLVKTLAPGQLLVYASTTAFYGEGVEAGESNHEEIDTSTMYNRTKYRAEAACMERANSISLRFATIFGVSTKMRHDLLPHDFLRRAIHDRAIVLFQPESVRSFIHIKDAVDAYEMALEKSGLMKGEIFNVGDESLNLSKRWVAEEIQKQTGCQIITSDMNHASRRDFVIRFDKLRKLGFKASRTFGQGIEELTRLYRCLGATVAMALAFPGGASFESDQLERGNGSASAVETRSFS